MAAEWYVESTKAEGLRFKITKLDKATKRATLVGETGVPFERSIAAEDLAKYGYQIVKRDAPPPPPAQ